MSNLKSLFLFLGFLSTPFLNFSQQSIEIRDLKTEEPIPFVKVYPSTGSPFLADIDGRFNWKPEWESIRLVYSGYSDSTFYLEQNNARTLYLNSKIQEIQEVTAMAGENPAHRILDLVIANRKQNNPLDNDSFKYRSYSKFIAEIDEGVLANISDTTTDTNLISTRDFIKSTHLFLIETSSIRTFVPPSRDREEVIAYKVSGVQDPLFATIAKEMQSFSFYDNQFNILSKTYINPIALGGTRRYLFQLQDTTLSGPDTVFHVTFRPRKDKNFDGLQGTLFINT
ncbi:MAG: hypothetical protein KJ941_02195, partial [Bacteroidetes bacterium]|nr:hypothetical protein [Bacteroidota bacterium]